MTAHRWNRGRTPVTDTPPLRPTRPRTPPGVASRPGPGACIDALRRPPSPERTRSVAVGAACCQGIPGMLRRDPRRALRSRTRDERGAVLMGVGSWSTGLMRAGRRPVTAGLVVVGIAALSVAALPAPVAGAAPRPATWTQQTPTASPPARYDASMAYDPATEDTVLLGGANGSMLDDTWTRNATVWAEQSPTTSPSARFGASMDYDTATHDVVLFGGGTSSGSAFGDTWTYGSP